MTDKRNKVTASDHTLTRRHLLRTTAGAFLAAPVVLSGHKSWAQDVFAPVEDNDARIQRNISSFRAREWQPYFSHTRGGAILVDIDSRALHYWSPDQSTYRLYPTSIPISEDLTRRGRTSVTQKVEGPGWAPTPAMKRRNPEWPDYIPPGPDNPLGTHALYLGWKYYRIHGTHDTRKIGRRSSNGCIGLYNEHIADLFSIVQPGAQVLLI